jgi:enolase
MELRSGEKTERQLVEDYIAQFSIESMLDEVLNVLLEERPVNPYTTMAKLIEAKTMPEIMDVTLTAIIVEGGVGAIEARVVTNLGEFISSSSDLFVAPPGSDVLRDMQLQAQKVVSLIKLIDPRNQAEIDAALKSDAAEGLDVGTIVAVSQACCRAGSRHRGVPLFNYIATMGDTVEQIPLPVSTAAHVQLGGAEPTNMLSQEVLLYPVSSTFFDAALESLVQASAYIKVTLAASQISEDPAVPATGPRPISTIGGCPRVASYPLPELMDLVVGCTKGNVTGEIKAAVEYAHTGIAKFGTDGGVSYFPEGSAVVEPGSEKASVDIIESIIATWRASEMVSIEDPLHPSDLQGYRMLKEKIGVVMDEIRADAASTELPLALRGIGMDASCPIQIVADDAVPNAAAIKKWESEAIFNTVKIKMTKVRTVTDAIALAKAARDIGWQVIVGCEEGRGETADSFIADLAVGVAAGQFQGGGMESAEHCVKYNRLLQISKENEGIRFVGRNFR